MRLTNFEQTNKGAVLSFSDATPSEVRTEVGSFLESSGLRLEEGDESLATWGSGSKAGRALGGALAKRRKYDVSIEGSDPVRVTVASAMSGWSGGAIGASKEKKQRKEMVQQLHQHFSSRYGS